jgi:hypothetical protein
MLEMSMTPAPVRDFIFDLHQATRRSLRIEDVQKLYDVKFREVTEKYFVLGPWPSSVSIASECDSDDAFLLFYR